MNFLEALEAETSSPGGRCYTCRALYALPAQDRNQVVEAYAAHNNRSAVWRAFKAAYGAEFSEAAFHNHFRRGHVL